MIWSAQPVAELPRTRTRRYPAYNGSMAGDVPGPGISLSGRQLGQHQWRWPESPTAATLSAFRIIPSSLIAGGAWLLGQKVLGGVCLGLSGTRHYVSNFRGLPAAGDPSRIPAVSKLHPHAIARRNCGSLSKCRSRVTRARSCSIATAAIHKSLSGTGVPARLSCTNK